MFVRTACLLAALAFAFPRAASAQEGRRPLFAPTAPKPRVVSKPAPAPAAKATPTPRVTPAPGAPATAGATPKPLARRRPARPADPLAAYVPTVKLAFAARWQEAVTPLMKDFIPGNVSVLFKLDGEGKVTDFTVTQNTSNEAFAKFCEQFVRETPFEKPPEKALAEGHVEIPFTFWIY
jgi:TonB family protein